jgi:pimeloyl-ACP methyl ester carboxylesterase
MRGATKDRPSSTLFVRTSGPVGAPAILFLHGIGNSGGMWSRHMERLQDFHCLAPDLPGFGRSNHQPWRSRIETADRVAELIQGLPRRRAHIVGLSLGGSIAFALLDRHAVLLDRVVVDGCGVLPWWGTRLITLGVSAISPILHTRPVIGAIARAYGLDDVARADLRAASPRAFRRAFADANRTRMTRAQVSAPCPTLLVAGEGEVKPPVRASNAALAAMMPDAVARFVPGRGHGWLGADPDLHLRMVEAWVTGTELPSELRPETSAWDRSSR